MTSSLIADHAMAGSASVCEILKFTSDQEYAEAFAKIVERLRALLTHYDETRFRQLKRLGKTPRPSAN